MGMLFDFAVSGVPRAHSSRSRGTWQAKVRAAAGAAWPVSRAVLEQEIAVLVVYFYRGATALDVDNMAKPILDSLSGIVYRDDGLISQLLVRKTELHEGLEIRDPTPALAEAVAGSSESGRDFVYVRIDSAPDHGGIP